MDSQRYLGTRLAREQLQVCMGWVLWCNSVVQFCGAILWCNSVVHICGAYLCAILWCNSVVQLCGAIVWCISVVHICGAYLWSIARSQPLTCENQLFCQPKRICTTQLSATFPLSFQMLQYLSRVIMCFLFSMNTCGMIINGCVHWPHPCISWLPSWSRFWS